MSGKSTRDSASVVAFAVVGAVFGEELYLFVSRLHREEWLELGLLVLLPWVVSLKLLDPFFDLLSVWLGLRKSDEPAPASRQRALRALAAGLLALLAKAAKVILHALAFQAIRSPWVPLLILGASLITVGAMTAAWTAGVKPAGRVLGLRGWFHHQPAAVFHLSAP